MNEEFVESLATSSTPYALAMADLDHFKRLNDLQGHEGGDRALRIFAEVLRKSVRHTDYVARWGGEEFAVLFPQANADQAFQRVQHIRTHLAETLRALHHTPFTVSLGIADSTMADCFEEVPRIADEALYSSKDNGRDRATIAAVATDRHVEAVLSATHSDSQRRSG
jgi:diguanylate cyclase (GGDEF)-like protein